MKLNLQFLSRPLTKEVLFTLATFLFLIPKPYHTIPALDASWQVALETAFFKGWEFGRTVNFTGGPLSLLYAPTSLSTHVFSQIAAESAVLILAIFLIFRAMRGQATLMSVLLFGSLLVCSVVANDGIFMVSITAGAFILLRLENSRWAPILIPIYFAVLALMKFSFATLGILCILTLTVGKLLNNDRQTAGKLVGSYVLSFLFIWILIGQNLRTIPGFFINSYYISKGYLWNMHLHDVQTIFFYLVYLLIITSVPIFLFCLAKRREIESWLSLVIAAGTIYLSWKAGITRTGSHMGFFLQAVVVVSFLVKPLASDRKLAAIWVSIITISFISGFIWVYPGGAKPVVSTAWKKFTENLVFIGNPDTLNQSFTRLIPYVLLENELPQIKQKVGDSSIDVLHFQQAILILNGMNYEPRPTVQNYPAYNHHLSNLNLTHIKNSPPKFLIVKYGVI
ncbi:MAG: hypothetical protein O7C75_09505, partial [Verrucomicrobia bacterium]|nr:hypothetical protein [Verrucomicrobiota bacterium]